MTWQFLNPTCFHLLIIRCFRNIFGVDWIKWVGQNHGRHSSGILTHEKHVEFYYIKLKRLLPHFFF